MAHILILDDSDVACLALRGILTARGHSCTTVPGVEQAWSCIHDAMDIDLVIVELKLKVQNSLSFIQRVRRNGLFKSLPLLVYTNVSDPGVVKSALALSPQNYLLKPYRPELVHIEIDKALAAVWRESLEDENAVAVRTGTSSTQIKQQRGELASALSDTAQLVVDISDSGAGLRALPRLKALGETARNVGAPRIAGYVEELIAEAEAEQWWVFKECGPTLLYAARLLRGETAPASASATPAQSVEEPPPRDRDLWQVAERGNLFPLPSEHLQAALDALTACPVIDSVSAAFVMAAESGTANLNHLDDLVSQDPSLAASVLMAANHLARQGDFNAIEDTSTAVSMLGNVKLSALTRSLPGVPEGQLHLPDFSWAQFRLFQLGVGRMSDFVCRAVELKALEPLAGTAGLLHDVGQLLIMHAYPHGFTRMIEFARQHGVSLEETEKRFLGASVREYTTEFFTKHGLPHFYCSVIRHVHNPAEAHPSVSDLVAVVALARHLCLQNGVGSSGDMSSRRAAPALEDTEAWGVLRDSIFPGFNLRKFQVQAHDYCVHLKKALAAGQKADVPNGPTRAPLRRAQASVAPTVRMTNSNNARLTHTSAGDFT